MTETQKENVKEIANLLCGKSLQVDLFEGNKYYCETPSNIYRIEIDECNEATIYRITKFPEIQKFVECIWSVSMEFNLTKMKAIFKILQSK